MRTKGSAPLFTTRRGRPRQTWFGFPMSRRRSSRSLEESTELEGDAEEPAAVGCVEATASSARILAQAEAPPLKAFVPLVRSDEDTRNFELYDDSEVMPAQPLKKARGKMHWKRWCGDF